MRRFIGDVAGWESERVPVDLAVIAEVGCESVLRDDGVDHWPCGL